MGMKKLLFLLLISWWAGGSPALLAQGMPVVSPPGAVPQRPAQPPRPVTLDVEASSRKPSKLKPTLKPDKQKPEKKTSKPKAGAQTGHLPANKQHTRHGNERA